MKIKLSGWMLILALLVSLSIIAFFLPLRTQRDVRSKDVDSSQVLAANLDTVTDSAGHAPDGTGRIDLPGRTGSP